MVSNRRLYEQENRMTFVSGLPLTERERTRCVAVKKRAQSIADRQAFVRRKSVKSGQNYNRAPTEADKRLTQRILGELAD